MALSFETAESIRTPSVRQISVFLDDRVGALHRLFQSFEGANIKILAVSVVHAIDCAVIRLMFDDTDGALEILKGKKFPYSQTEMLVVEMPHGHGLRSICSALLSAEVSIEYIYPLLARPTGRAALAIHTDDLETAASVLRNGQCTLMAEEDLGTGGIR